MRDALLGMHVVGHRALAGIGADGASGSVVGK